MLKLLLSALIALPDLVRLILEVTEKISEASKMKDRRNLAKQIKEGVHDARVNKDTSKLEALFKGNV